MIDVGIAGGVTAASLNATPLDVLARLLFELDAVEKQIRQAVVERMAADSVERVELPGVGLVSYSLGGFGSRVDSKALTTRFEELVARLRALGEEVDDSLPVTTFETSAGVRVQKRGPDWTGAKKR